MDATILKDKESATLEAKSAANGLPRSIWETYSAFANTYGGTILLGVREEKDGTLTPIGLDDPEGMLKIFWNTISNRTKVNVNLLSSSDVEIKDISGKRIIVINVPQATCLDKPIYLNGNISEAYRRNGDGDYRCTEREIFAMIRDSSSARRACKIVCVNGKCYCKEGDTADDQEKHKGKGCHRPDTRPAGPAWNDAGGAVWCRGAGEEAYSPAAEQGA